MLKQLYLLVCLLLTCHSLFGQTTLEHYHPTETILKEGIFKCEISIADNKGNPDMIREVFLYDHSANITEDIRYYQNFSFKFSYDETGQKTAQYLVPFGGDFFERDTFIYDRKGRLEMRASYNASGHPKRRNEYKFCGKRLKAERYFYEDELQFKSRYTYVGKKRIKKVTKKLKKQFLGAWEYTYDDQDNLKIFRLINKDGQQEALQKMKYDSHGRRTEMAVYNQNNELIQLYKTNYDDQGLITTRESYTSIKQEDLKQSNYLKTIYKYYK